MNIRGKITGFDGKTLTIEAPFSDGFILEKQKITECEVYLHDNRQLSPTQRNKIFALIGDMAEFFSGAYHQDAEKSKRAIQEVLCEMQLNYLIEISRDSIRRQLTLAYCQLSNIDLFSLSPRSENTIDMTTARDFIDWLVELCIKHGIPTSDCLLNRCEDIDRYLYACLSHRTCCLSGKKADIHHDNPIGMGANRDKMSHVGLLAIALNRKYHKEAHDIGLNRFNEKYHIYGIKLDEYLVEKLNLGKIKFD